MTSEHRKVYMRELMRAKRARQRAERAADAIEVLTYRAHCDTWFASLSDVERLQFRAWVRRCGTAAFKVDWRDC